MKIGILGTRGIPNHYGGFEQFAEYLSIGLVSNGHEVFVYCSHDHPYKESKWHGVNLIHIYDPEKKVGTFGQFLYDLLSINNSRKHNFDILLQLGYTSSSVWSWLLPRKCIVVTNMDGLEWKRTKYSKAVRKFLRFAERIAVSSSHHLIADSTGIQDYLKTTYKKQSKYLPYGTSVFSEPDVNQLALYYLKPHSYDMMIARMEPENNIETILDGITASTSAHPVLVIGNNKNKYGQYLTNKYTNDQRIQFLGSNYDINRLNNLRYYSRIYFHGHSVGGTNPSLLEAIASNALICAHQNEFNEAILGKEALYFKSSGDVTNLLNSPLDKKDYAAFLGLNLKKVNENYLWPKIISDYEAYFRSILPAP